MGSPQRCRNIIQAKMTALIQRLPNLWGKKYAIIDEIGKISPGNGVWLPERGNCQPISGLITPTERRRVGGSFFMPNYRPISVGKATGRVARYRSVSLEAHRSNPTNGV